MQISNSNIQSSFNRSVCSLDVDTLGVKPMFQIGSPVRFITTSGRQSITVVGEDGASIVHSLSAEVTLKKFVKTMTPTAPQTFLVKAPRTGRLVLTAATGSHSVYLPPTVEHTALFSDEKTLQALASAATLPAAKVLVRRFGYPLLATAIGLFMEPLCERQHLTVVRDLCQLVQGVTAVVFRLSLLLGDHDTALSVAENSNVVNLVFKIPSFGIQGDSEYIVRCAEKLTLLQMDEDALDLFLITKQYHTALEILLQNNRVSELLILMNGIFETLAKSEENLSKIADALKDLNYIGAAVSLLAKAQQPGMLANFFDDPFDRELYKIIETISTSSAAIAENVTA
jgi:hypothetical protein